MWRRVAHELAAVEPDPARAAQWESEFYWLLSDFRFLPGGRIMHGAGNARKVTLLNCYCTAIREDSIEGIYEAAYRAAKTYSRGGGIGVDLTPLRPKGAPVHNAARASTGAVSFMELFSLTTGLIGQSGRRGALMITIADHHPDVLDFCRVKRNLTSVRYANISVRLSDAFMQAVERDGPWTLWFESEVTGRIERQIRARELWDELIAGARDWAEPGALFWDTVLRYGTSNYSGMTPICTNPCNEIPLEDGGACNLGSLALSAFVVDPFTPQARVDYEALQRAARVAVRFLDNVLVYNEGRHALPEQEEAARRGRRIGVGITGLGDALVMLGLRYDSDAAIETAESIMRSIKEAVYRASVALAREKGPFPAFDVEQHLEQAFFWTFPSDLINQIRRNGLRNVSLLTIPPVGSGSALAGCTNGLEPIFALSYIRRSESLSQEYFRVLHPLVARYLRATGQEIDQDELSQTGDPDSYLRERLPRAFVTAHEIDPLKRVAMQAALQRHIDQAISSTVNLPRGADASTVERVYFEAWRAGLKGISVYVEGSREGVLLTPEEAKRRHTLVALSDKITAIAREAVPSLPANGAATPEQQVEAVVRTLAALARERPQQLELIATADGLLRDRPERLDGPTYRIPTPFGTAFVTITERDGEPYEVFGRLGKAGSDAEADAEGIGRLCSVVLRLRGLGAGLERLQIIVDQLERIGGSRALGFGPNRVRSIPDAFAVALRKYLRDKDVVEVDTPGEIDLAAVAGAANGDLCPRCHERTLVTSEGCTRCANSSCGFKEC